MTLAAARASARASARALALASCRASAAACAMASAVYSAIRRSELWSDGSGGALSLGRAEASSGPAVSAARICPALRVDRGRRRAPGRRRRRPSGTRGRGSGPPEGCGRRGSWTPWPERRPQATPRPLPAGPDRASTVGPVRVTVQRLGPDGTIWSAMHCRWTYGTTVPLMELGTRDRGVSRRCRRPPGSPSPDGVVELRRPRPLAGEDVRRDLQRARTSPGPPPTPRRRCRRRRAAAPTPRGCGRCRSAAGPAVA